jgi:hypothetical protein
MATANARFARRFLMRELIFLPHLADLPDEVFGLLNECSMTEEYAPNIAVGLAPSGKWIVCFNDGNGIRVFGAGRRKPTPRQIARHIAMEVLECDQSH